MASISIRHRLGTKFLSAAIQPSSRRCGSGTERISRQVRPLRKTCLRMDWELPAAAKSTNLVGPRKSAVNMPPKSQRKDQLEENGAALQKGASKHSNEFRPFIPAIGAASRDSRRCGFTT